MTQWWYAFIRGSFVHRCSGWRTRAGRRFPSLHGTTHAYTDDSGRPTHPTSMVSRSNQYQTHADAYFSRYHWKELHLSQGMDVRLLLQCDWKRSGYVSCEGRPCGGHGVVIHSITSESLQVDEAEEFLFAATTTGDVVKVRLNKSSVLGELANRCQKS